MILRDYQQECLSVIWKALPKEETILIQAATGAGKTIIFCELNKQILSKWPAIRIGILAHRRELISQAKDKMLRVWPDAGSKIGIACGTIQKHVDVRRPITIGTIQTLSNKIENTKPFDIIIIDEAHRIPPMNDDNQYAKWIKAMQELNPRVRIIGFTATPFRLGHGYIYGKTCRPDNENLFSDLNYRIGIQKLQGAGYLCPLIAKETKNISFSLSGIKRIGGDYSTRDVSDLMSEDLHVGSAIEAIREYASDRKHIVVFAVTIEHAEILSKTFNHHGISAATVHSKMATGQRDMILRNFDAGRFRVIVNVGILTEGWDSPHADCGIMCRPTLSPALFVQMIGRMLRISNGKKDALILDLANNFRTHGMPDNPRVIIPGRKKESINGDDIIMTCPECMTVVAPQTRICPECGKVLVQEKKYINERVEMQNVKTEPDQLEVDVIDYNFNPYTSRKGNEMIKLAMTCKPKGMNTIPPFFVNHFFDFEGQGSEFGMRRARTIWNKIVGTAPPSSVQEAAERSGEFLMSMPNSIVIEENGKFWNVKKWS